RGLRKATEKMPADSDALSGVSAIAQVPPPSAVRSTRLRAAAPVPIHARPPAATAMLVPLPAKAPSFGSAGGSAPAGTRVHVAPPSRVVRMTKLPSTESLIARPRRASQNVIASEESG